MSSLSISSRKSLVHLLGRLSSQVPAAVRRGQGREYLCALDTRRQISLFGAGQRASSGGGDWKLSTKGGVVRGKVQQDIGESTILVQQGTQIQEVPVAVLKSNNLDNLHTTECLESELEEQGIEKTPATATHIKVLDPREEEAFIEGFSRFHSPKEILKILDTIPASEVTAPVALCIIRKLFELENNFSFRNNGKSWLITSEENTNHLESFGRMAIVSRLIDTVISSENNQILLDTLVVLGSESNNPSTMRYYFETNEEFLNYRLKLCNEVLIRTIEGKLSLQDVCRAICSIGQIGKSTNNKHVRNEMQIKFLDKMWVGILERSNEINSENVSTVFSTIPYLSKSRRLVMNIIEKKIISIWWNLKLSQIASICEVLSAERKLSKFQDSNPCEISNRVLMAFSRNLSLNLHKVTEEEMGHIIKAFYVLNFVDPTTEKTLSRYMKAKCLNITDSTLVTLVMEYVAKFRLRSSHILEGVSEYAMAHNLSPTQLTSILIPFGLLDFQPPNAVKFWQSIEKVLTEKFIQFSPRDIIDVLLSFIYLQKFPLNFVPHIFSPYFLDRLHSNEADFTVLQQTRGRLKLLDSALTLECGPKYCGPLLPKDFTAKSMLTDGRIQRIVHVLEGSFKSIFKKSTCITETCVKLPNMPFNELYFVDLFINQIHISTSAEQQEDVSDDFNSKKATDILRNRFNPRISGTSTTLVSKASIDQQQKQYSKELIAVLIHIPEHYCSDGKHLIGPQVMRIRHLKLLGCTVVSLRLETLAELRVQPQSFRSYLQESLTIANVETT